MEKNGEAVFSVASGEWRVAGAESENPVARGWWLVASVLFSKFIVSRL